MNDLNLHSIKFYYKNYRLEQIASPNYNYHRNQPVDNKANTTLPISKVEILFKKIY